METRNNQNTTVDFTGYNLEYPYTIYNNASFSNLDILKQAICILQQKNGGNFSMIDLKETYKELRKLLYEN